MILRLGRIRSTMSQQGVGEACRITGLNRSPTVVQAHRQTHSRHIHLRSLAGREDGESCLGREVEMPPWHDPSRTRQAGIWLQQVPE
jgi:hypothetical protein